MPIYGTDKNHPIKFDEEGNLIDQTTGEKGMMKLPDIEVFPQGGGIIRRKSDGSMLGIGSVQLPEVTVYGHNRKPLPGKLMFKDLLKQIYTREDTYSNSHRKFNFDVHKSLDNVVTKPNGKKYNLMEMMGMTNIPFRRPKYFFLDSDSNVLHGCARNANLINRYYNKPTAGHAWTRHGIYGDSAILVNPDKSYEKPSIIRQFDPVNWKNGEYIKDNIENVRLKTGDIVDIAYPGSSYKNKAIKEGDKGRRNTHTGTILKTSPRKEDTFIMHSTGEGIRVEPIGDFIGPKLFNMYITGIRRPGTKSHPYNKK